MKLLGSSGGSGVEEKEEKSEKIHPEIHPESHQHRIRLRTRYSRLLMRCSKGYAAHLQKWRSFLAKQWRA
jgi:hypothetical protein